MRRLALFACFWISFTAAPAFAQLRAFPIRFVNGDVVYLEGGSAAGLKEGMRLSVKRPGPGQSALQANPVAELVVLSVASTSAACEIVRREVTLQAGDQAFVSLQDLETSNAAAIESEAFAQIVEFDAGGDPLEEELRARVPKAPLSEVNRFQGRIGFEEDSVFDRSGAGQNSHQQGITFRFDFTRIGDSYWNLEGYWRARISATKRSLDQQPITDVLQRVYQFGLRYGNPRSRLVMGFGRVLVPWASSLSTLDGGYVGVRLNRTVTVGSFAGTTPDPTAWNYDPDRQLLGVFASLDRGSFEHAHYALTGGVAVSRLSWEPERQFAFVENGILLGRKLSLHHNVEADYRSVDRFASTRAVSLTRSFATLRYQPVERLSLDLSHNYFRVLPTPDERLIVTQQVDNLLFRGLNAGARLEIVRGLTAYGSAGQSGRSGDGKMSWNRMGGVSVQVPRTGLRAEARYSRFSGTVGAGNYRSVLLRRETSQRFRIEVEGGDQTFEGLFMSSRTWYGTGSMDVYAGRFIFGFRGTRYHGSAQKYDQLRTSVDFRF